MAHLVSSLWQVGAVCKYGRNAEKKKGFSFFSCEKAYFFTFSLPVILLKTYGSHLSEQEQTLFSALRQGSQENKVVHLSL